MLLPLLPDFSVTLSNRFLKSFSALAESVNDYCLTKADQHLIKDFTGQADPYYRPVTLSLLAGGKQYKLISGIHHIGLSYDHNQLIETYDARQEQGRIENIEIKGNTLMIDGGTDYKFPTDLKVAPPHIGGLQYLVNLDFTAGGKSYKLVAESNHVILLDDQKNRISAIAMDQYSEDGIFPISP